MDVTQAFEREIARLRETEVPGASGRVRNLFDYLADRGPHADSASQDELAREVFGQDVSDADDATVRVYVHRLRKKLDEFYDSDRQGQHGARIELPSGIYALRLATDASDLPPSPSPSQPEKAPKVRFWAIAATLGLVFVLGAMLAVALMRTPAPNPLWQPLVSSDRPVLVVLGDYYIYGEIDPVRPDAGRLIRDFRVDSEEDLAALQDAEPERYGMAEDVGLTYLPFSTAYALQQVVPILERSGKEVRIVAASDLRADVLRENDIVYLGLLSGMGLLERPVFDGSMLRVGSSYDELIDTATDRSFVSEEFRRLAAPVTYRDYGYVARFADDGGGVLLVIAGARETGLRSVARIAGSADLPDDLAARARDTADVEALFQVTGQQGADLSEQLVLARGRPR